MKKVFLGMGVSLIFLIWLFPQPVLDRSYCAFCDPNVLASQSFYEDDLVRVLYTHKPILPGHCLIIPKRHVERFEELSDPEMLRICQVIRRVDDAVKKVFATSSYLLVQKNGVEVGQSVPHVHVHYIPKKKGDTSIVIFLLRIMRVFLPPISQEDMQKRVDELSEKMEMPFI